MNYYDEEITISGPQSKLLSSVKVERLSSGKRGAAARQRHLQLHGNSTDDDGLLQDIIDHDDDDEAEDSEEDDSELHLPAASQQMQPVPRPQTRPGSTRNAKPKTPLQLSEDEEQHQSNSMSSDEATSAPLHKLPLPAQQRSAAEVQLSLTPDKWEQLPLQPELKEIFPFILKYTPQSIETPYQLQPFIPEFVPAVGDVDALLKVQPPELLQPQRQKELDEHLQRLGLYLLDEPSGAQSEPSLLNMKLRSALSGQNRHSNNSAASLVPTARSSKDIDKWIGEVEQLHMAQSLHDQLVQPRRNIDALIEDWPREFAEASNVAALDQAYRGCLQDQLSLLDYVRLLSERFGVEGPLESQADYIHNVQTLFALYLAASQAWE